MEEQKAEQGFHGRVPSISSASRRRFLPEEVEVEGLPISSVLHWTAAEGLASRV